MGGYHLTQKSTISVAKIFFNNNFFFSKMKSGDPLSLLHSKKNLKKRKIKFGIKIQYWKIIRIGYLIA